MEYFQSCKHLGFHLVSHDYVEFFVVEDLHGLFGSVNSTLFSVQNCIDAIVLFFCVPKSTFGAAVKELKA